jgi:hypothetical protein
VELLRQRGHGEHVRLAGRGELRQHKTQTEIIKSDNAVSIPRLSNRTSLSNPFSFLLKSND